MWCKRYAHNDNWQSEWLYRNNTSAFPQSATQISVVHQIRNSCRYVVWKDLKEFLADMEEIYTSVNRDQAAISLEHFEQK